MVQVRKKENFIQLAKYFPSANIKIMDIYNYFVVFQLGQAPILLVLTVFQFKVWRHS